MYDGTEVWNAVVHQFISIGKIKLWYVELLNKRSTIEEEQIKWSQTGFRNGYCLGAEIEKAVIIRRMFSLGYTLKEIENIVCMNEELREKAKKLFDSE